MLAEKAPTAKTLAQTGILNNINRSLNLRDIGSFLALLTHVKAAGKDHWMADCPCSGHKTPASHLSVSLADQKILLKCFGSDTAEDIVGALGLTLADLFIEPSDKIGQLKSIPEKIIAEYTYQNEDGKELFQVVRYEPKSFRQRHKNGSGEWVWNLEGVRRTLYHLPELLLATNETVYLVEGEKDCDNLWAWGQVSTTSPGGANGWRDEYAVPLTGKKVCIIPDKDSPGLSYARQTANSLTGKVADLKVVLLPDGVKDISDWLTLGNDITELALMQQDIEALFASDKPVYRQEESSIRWDKKVGDSLLLTFKAEKLSEERTGVHARVSIFGQRESLSWSYLNIERREDRSSLAGAAFTTLKTDVIYTKTDMVRDLDSFCAGLWDFHVASFKSEIMSGDSDNKPLTFVLKPYILEDGGTILFAPPGRGKSYSVMLWVVSVDAGVSTHWLVSQRPVLFINLERSRQSVRRRLGRVNMALGLPADRPLLTLNARGKSLSDVIASARKDIRDHHVGLVVLDSISRAGLGDLNENKSVNSIIDALSSLCPTWVALGHTPRQDESHIFGGIHFDAGADVVVQLNSCVTDNGTLGVGWQIIKQNDLPQFPQKIMAFEFDSGGLQSVRLARPFEFPDIEAKKKQDMLSTLIDHVANQDTGDTTASQASEALGFNRANISRLFSSSGRFVKTRTEGRAQFYGVKQI